MSKKNKILFVGNFLSKTRGSLGVVESIFNDYDESTFGIKLTSKYENKILRTFDFLFCLCFSKYSLIHVDIYSGNAFYFTRLSLFISKIRQKKIIGTLHGGGLPIFDKRNPTLVNNILKQFDLLNSPSNYLIDYFKRYNLQINYLPNPISLKCFTQRKENKNKFSFLWVRAFDKIYNPDLAIKTILKLKKFFPDVKMTMIGPDRGELKKCKKLINKLDLQKNIKIIGFVPNKDLPQYYNDNFFYLNTTSFESFGLSLVEAAACGCIIISTSVGDIPLSWKNNEDIILINSFNPTDFCNKIIGLFKNEKLITKIRCNAIAKSKKFDLIKIKKEWINLLKRSLN